MPHSSSASRDRTTRQAGLCSVVCTTYNHAKFSRAAIESVLAQDYRPLEIIVIDDGSTDANVAAIRQALAHSAVQHTILTQENTGNVARNANRALAAAKGEFVVLLSLDDLLLPGCISSKMCLMAADRSLVMVGNSTMSKMDMGGTIIRAEVRNPVFGQETATCQSLREIEFATAGAFFLQGAVLRAETVDRVGGFDEDMAGDDLILRTKIWNHLITNPSLGFALLQTPGFVYRTHGENLHRNTVRQLRTLLDWRNRYFPDRPLPDIAQRRARRYFAHCLDAHDDAALQQALALDPLMPELYARYRKSWDFHRRSMKNALSRVFFVAKPRA